MPLSNIEISAELNAKRLVIDPLLSEDQIGPSSVDLRLHPELTILPSREQSAGITIDPTAPNFRVRDFLETVGQSRTLAPGEGYQLASRQFLIGKTLEYVELPNHLAGRIEGKSTLARLGLTVHMTAPTVQAGFRGRLVLEMFNYGSCDLTLRPEMLIAQLILEHLGLPPTEGYHGHYAGQE